MSRSWFRAERQEPMKPLDAPNLDRIFDSLTAIFTPEIARKLVQYCFDPKVHAHIDMLARKCNEGHISDKDRREYESYVHAIDFIAILQAKARALLTHRA
jgi:hypothetical protein